MASTRRVRDELLSLDGSPDEDDAKDPIPRIRTYQQLLLETVTPVEQLDALATLDLRMLAMRLELKLYSRLLTTTAKPQEREWYEARIKFRRDILTELSLSRQRGEAEGRIQSMQKSLQNRITPLEELEALSLPELEDLAARLRAELRDWLASCS